MKFCEVSKALGWDNKILAYPSMLAVEKAIEEKDLYNILNWNRFLKSPTNDKEIKIINRIVEGLTQLRKEFP